MTLVEIAKTWAHYARANEETRELSHERLPICDICPNKKQLLNSGGIQHAGDNKPDSVFYCGACGCSLWAKASNEENICPASKWQAS